MDDLVRELLRSVRGSRVRSVAYRLPERHPPHAHAESSITLILRGGFVERVGRAELTAGPLSVLVKPAGLVHANEFLPGTRTVQIYLSAADQDDLCRGGELGAWREESAGESARLMLGLAHSGATPGGTALDTGLEDRLAEIVGALSTSRRQERGSAPGWLPRAREALREPGTTVREAAAAAGVHPVHLARRFRLAYGETPTQFRSRMRLCRAAAILAADRSDLAGAAAGAGYADQSHMSRELLRRLGVTPRTFRTLAHRLPTGCIRSRLLSRFPPS